MESTSLAYRQGKYPEIFEAARSNRLREDQMVAYSESLERLRDTQKGIKYMADKSRAEGRAEGIAEGVAKTKSEIVVKMLEKDFTPELIASLTGLSLAEIAKINN